MVHPSPAGTYQMAPISGQTHLSIFLVFTLALLLHFVHAKLQLDPSDRQAILAVHKHLGVKTPSQRLDNPCNFAGIFCERRITNSSYALRVTRIVIRSQQLRGFISPEIGRLSELKELSLPNNQLVDQISARIADCRKLEILDLENNRFTGEVPSRLSSLIRLRVLDLSSNKFSGNLDFLEYFPNLEKLDLSNNMFTGKVPHLPKSFRNLQFFNISGNNLLEGPLAKLNRVEPRDKDTVVPNRYILTENATRRNQTHAAIAPTGAAGVNSSAQAPSSAATHHRHKSKKKKVKGWIIGFAAGSMAGTLSGLAFSVLFKLIMAWIKGVGKGSGLAIFSPLIKKAEDLAFLEKQDGLAALEIIGKGGCGEVYRAELPRSNGKMIAIKKIVQPPKDAAELAEEDSKLLNKKMRQIRSEIQTVGQIRHRNLLPLLAHMPRPDCHYLVYEYMKNGSLQDKLHTLDWLARHRVALGVAAGLEYLHASHSPKIIHRDLKPANILLDDDFEPRIADFGLAKAVPDALTHVTTSNVAGTAGYIAPEYYQTLKFTEKCDIYSFGVILGVLVMGRYPSDEFFQNTPEVSLVKWMRNVMTSVDPKKAIDPRLIGNGYEEQMLLVLKIACFCTLDNPKERPLSKDVRAMLSQINHDPPRSQVLSSED